MQLLIAGLRAGLCAALAALPLQAHAQADDTLVVLGTRFADDARRLPASTTVLGADDIAKSAARALPELLAEQAGITLKDFYGNNAALTSVDLRGYGVTGTQNTLVLVNGRRVTDIDLSGVQWAAIPLASIERIEVLRGTGAVLYGDGASAGVVNIVTRSPLKQGTRAEAFGRAASYATREGQLYGSVANADFGLNAAAHGYAADGYRANNRNVQKNGSVDLRWGPGEAAVDLRVGVDRQDLRLPGARSVQPSIGLDEYGTDPRGAQTPLDYSSRDGRRAGVGVTQRVGAAEFSIGLDGRDKDQRAYYDQNGFPIYRADALKLVSFTPRVRIPFATEGLRHRLTLGADRHAWDYDSRRANAPQNADQPINRVRATQDTRALYAQDQVEIGAATQLSLGWREERVAYDANDTFDASAPGACPFGFCGTQANAARETQTARAWEAGLRHALDRSASVFARAGRSFRFVNLDEIYENDAAFSAQFQILRPQRALTHEAGAEWRAHGAVLRATLFRSDVSDEIHLDPFTSGVGNTNLPPSRRRGVELDATWRPSAALRLHAACAWTDARFREGVLPGGPFAIGTNLDIAGRRVPLVPERKLNLGLAWEFAPRTELAGALAAQSRQHMDNDEPNTLGAMLAGYALVDLKLARRYPWGRAALTLNNALDKKYATYAVRSAFTADRYSVYPLPGRTLGASAEVFLD